MRVASSTASESPDRPRTADARQNFGDGIARRHERPQRHATRHSPRPVTDARTRTHMSTTRRRMMEAMEHARDQATMSLQRAVGYVRQTIACAPSTHGFLLFTLLLSVVPLVAYAVCIVSGLLLGTLTGLVTLVALEATFIVGATFVLLGVLGVTVAFSVVAYSFLHGTWAILQKSNVVEADLSLVISNALRTAHAKLITPIPVDSAPVPATKAIDTPVFIQKEE